MRLIYVSHRTPAEDAQFRQLRAAYEDAFRQWSSQARLVQSLLCHSDPDSAEIRDAQSRLEVALAIYRQRRDSLAEFILAQSAVRKASGSAATRAATASTQASASEESAVLRGLRTAEPSLSLRMTGTCACPAAE